MIVYLNGAFLPAHDAHISIDDRGFLFADGVFETARVHRGRFFALDRHLQRFAASAATLAIAHPTLEEIAGIARQLARRNALPEAALRITLTRGREGSSQPTLLVTLQPVSDAALARAREGWHIITAQTRRPSVNSVPATLKSLGRTYSLLARQEARAAGVDDVLLLSSEDLISEGPTWNVFWRRAHTIYTPALETGVLEGVTRSILIDLARDLGYHVDEGAWPRPALDGADEIFASMTSVGLAPFRSLDRVALPGETPASDALYRAYWDYVAAHLAED